MTITSAELAEQYIEVIGSSTPQARNANEYAEILTATPTPQARNANEYAELLTPTPIPAARAGELYIEVLAPSATKVFIGWGSPL